MTNFAIILIFSLFAICHGFSIQPRILNGDLSNPEDYPFYVQILFKNRDVCGGTILSDRWIVTAAHCIKYESAASFYFGIASNGSFNAKMFVILKKQYIQPNYDDSTAADIALIKLPQQIKFNQFIQPVKLTHDRKIPHLYSQSVTAVGMGEFKMDEQTTSSERRLRRADFKTMFSQDCSDELAFDTDPETFVCARPNANGQSVSYGDSGGPLVLSGDLSFIGIMSARINKPHTNLLSFQMFTYVPYYYDWIERTTGLNLPICNESRTAATF